MQLIRNCTGEIRAKACNCDLIGCFAVHKLVIVRDGIILADDDSIAFDFRMPSSIFYVTFTCFLSVWFLDDYLVWFCCLLFI